MPDLPTSQDLFRIARDEVLVGNSNLARAVVERTGTDTNALVAAGVGIGDAVVGQLGKAVADLYLASARKAGLDRLIFDRYRYARKPAAPAVGQVQFTTSGAAAATFAIPIGTTLSTVDGVAFETTTAVSFAIGTLGPYSANVQSVNGGASQQAIAGSITTITGSISGAPANLHVTNASATAGASDEESDDDFRIRGQLAYTTQFRGTLNALVAGALTVPGVTKAVAFEYLDSTLEPARAVEVVVTDTFTEQLINSATSPASYQAQAAVLATTVKAALLDYRAAGIPVTVTIANVALQSVKFALAFVAGYDEQTVITAARASAVNFVNSLQPGSTLTVTGLGAAITATIGVASASILVPAGNVVPTATQVIRTSAGYVSSV